MSQKNVHVSVAERRSVFKKLCAQPENRVCFDCPQKKPMWASSTFGVFICLDCAGGQRRLGTHLTFVRSVDMDEWTPEQLESMKLGGNKKARLYFRENGVTDLHQRQDLKYSSVTAKTYRNKLQREVQAALATKAGTASQETVKERKKSIDEDGEKGLEKLMTSFGGSSLSQDTPTRATSAPELSDYTAAEATIQPSPSPEKEEEQAPAEEAVKEEIVFEKPKKKEPAAPKGTLSAGMLLGGGSTAKLPTNGSSATSINGRRRKTTKTLGARKLVDNSTTIDFVEPKPPKQEEFFDSKEPSSSRLAAAYQETTTTKPAKVEAPVPATNGRSVTPKKATTPDKPTGETAQARFSDVKGFGSDAFFGLEDDKKPSAPTAAARFAGSQGIGSDAFFDEDFSNTDSFDQLKNTASGLLASTIDRFR